MLYFVFTIDGDWDEYFDTRMSDNDRLPNKGQFLGFVEQEIDLAKRLINGKFLHFVHTSPRVREFFLQPEFISLWKKIEATGGSIGVHCHEDDPGNAYYADEVKKMEKTIDFLSGKLKNAGLNPISYRGGYMSFYHDTIPILEKNKIMLDFSCAPDRYLFHGEDLLVSDWRGAPHNFYRMSYSDSRRKGRSNVFEIPLGKVGDQSLYPENFSLFTILNVARKLRKKAKDKDVIVSVLAHSYDFNSPKMKRKLKLTLWFLRFFGKFINASEAMGIIDKK